MIPAKVLWMPMKLAYFLVGCLPVLGQTSDVSSVTKAPGDKLTLEISAHSQPGRAPVALKWEVVFPAQLMAFEGDATETGGAAKDSGKSLQCTARNTYSLSCTLSGGQKTIGNGLIATFHFKILTTAGARKTTLRIQKGAATTVDSKVLTLNDTQAIVIIQ
jgi:hypothetical protein